jgi:predicted alternative tryptophan synthase beta-subunit
MMALASDWGSGSSVLVNPAGSDMNLAAERQHMLDCYGGITFASPSGVTAFGRHSVIFIPDTGISLYAGRLA